MLTAALSPSSPLWFCWKHSHIQSQKEQFTYFWLCNYFYNNTKKSVTPHKRKALLPTKEKRYTPQKKSVTPNKRKEFTRNINYNLYGFLHVLQLKHLCLWPDNLWVMNVGLSWMTLKSNKIVRKIIYMETYKEDTIIITLVWERW